MFEPGVQAIPAPRELCLVPSLRLRLGAHHRDGDRRIVSHAETAPVDPEVIECLAQVDPASLDEDAALGLTVAWQRVTNYAEAQRTRAVTATVAASPETPQIPRELHAAAQVGPILGLGSGAADTIITASPELTTRLSATFAAMFAGDLSWRKASSLAMATIDLTDSQAAAVEAKVLDKAAQRSPARHDAAVRRAVEQIDPSAADRKRKQRERDIRLVKHHYGAGMGQLFADAPSELVDSIDLAATAHARRLKAAGDPRPLDVLRVHFLYAAAMSQLSHGTPATASNTATRRRRSPIRLTPTPGQNLRRITTTVTTQDPMTAAPMTGRTTAARVMIRPRIRRPRRPDTASQSPCRWYGT